MPPPLLLKRWNFLSVADLRKNGRAAGYLTGNIRLQHPRPSQTHPAAALVSQEGATSCDKQDYLMLVELVLPAEVDLVNYGFRMETNFYLS